MFEPLTTFATTYSSQLTVILRVVLILVTTEIVYRVLRTFIDTHFKRASKKSDINVTSVSLMKKVIRVIVYIVGIGFAIYSIPGLRDLSLTIFASAGFLGIVVGFAAQETISNMISGILIAGYQPFRIGDNVTANEKYGEVEDITLGHTIIRTPHNDRLIIPNSKIIHDAMVNHSIKQKKSRFDLDIGIGYEEDIDKARELIMDEISKNEFAITEDCSVIVTELSDSAILLRTFVWGKNRSDAWTATRELRESIKKRFDKEDVKIPYPHRTVKFKNPEHLGKK